VGLETEFAVQFFPSHAGDPAPTHEAVFRALLAALKTRFKSCEAIYYKGGEFLENGSLIHFEVGRLEDPTTGLVEWASPECLSARELVAYSKAQEKALAEAMPEAERALAAKGHEGRIVALKNNRDRFGNDYGTHESYDVVERKTARWRSFFENVLHPIVVVLLALAKVVVAAFLILIIAVMRLLTLALEVLGTIRVLAGPSQRVRQALGAAATYAFEPSARPGSGLVPRALFHLIRGAAALFTLTARTFFFQGHLAALYPFLATRQVFAGPGWLSPTGRFELSARASALEKSIGAYTYGRGRPMVDMKEFFFFRPWRWRSARKRLHLLVGDANRSEYAEHLKLATTIAVLDAIEAGALDAAARSVVLLGGPIGVLRAAASGPKAVVARDRETGAPLSALAVQRRWLEATWNHHRSLDPVDPDTKEALVRWSFVLDQLEHDPLALDRELDWALKKRLLDRTLEAALPGLPLEAAWERLQAFGPANAALEKSAPELELGSADPSALLAARLGERAFERLTRELPAGLSWADFPAARRAWLRLKVVDLSYHEVSVAGGAYDWLLRDGLVTRALAPEEVERALATPPPRTRARIRGEHVKNAASYASCRVGWDRVVIEPRGEPARTISLADAYRFQA
jgi:proteasome accessory factor A